ncbi:hypothetical protein [uncultured Brevundimonas sp.]|uniref:hypothetical protein n=1 Tax=uncultured Brevundimonas sp. TaxID=213418 RepID=UPI0030ED70AC|tara:strand:+ start:4593 stop:5123 length:531 start_codon:yes stop_codon:yes gene_type:complete
MISLAHLKRRLGQYAALWVGGFLLTGAAVLAGLVFTDLIVAVDMVLPVTLAAVLLAMGAGLVLSLMSGETVGTKLILLVLALLLVLPLLWGPMAAAVSIAFVLDRSIEYSQTYAAVQIGISRLLLPLTGWVFGGALVDTVWAFFQGVASVIGVVSAWVKLWPLLRRLLGPEPVREG